MSKRYTTEKVLKDFNESLKNKTIEELYKNPCINWKGTTSDTGEYYTEIISCEILKNYINALNAIPVTERRKSYKTESHERVVIDLKSPREEETLSKRLIGLKLDTLGVALDYQIPLKDTHKNSGLGKIDLLSYNSSTNTIYLIEVKAYKNKETLLRAALEIFTYSKILDHDKLVADYSLTAQGNPTAIIPTVLVTPETQAYTQISELVDGRHPCLKELLNQCGIQLFSLNGSVKKFEI